MSVSRWMDKEDMAYINIYIKNYYTAIQKWNLAIYDNKDRPRRYYANWIKSENNKYYMFHLCVESDNQMNKHNNMERDL